MTKESILAIAKADLTSTQTLRKEHDTSLKQYRDEYYGKLYGNEHPHKSKIISKDIRRQSEWQIPSLVDPFVSTSDIFKIAPVGKDDRNAARQKEILLNTQFCRQFNRFNFLTTAIKIADIEGSVIVQLGWDYQENSKRFTRYEFILEDNSRVSVERYQALLNQSKREAEMMANEIELTMFRERQQLQAQFQQTTQQAQQLQAQMRQAQQEGNEEALQQLSQQAQQIEQGLQEMQQELQQPVVKPDNFNMPMPLALVRQEIEEIEVLVNKPTAKVCRNEDVFIDPTCQGDLDKAQFVINRYETDLSSLRLDGRFTNLDKVEEDLTDSSNDPDGFETPDHTHFKFSDKTRKKVVVYEYWGNIDWNGDKIAEPIVCAWVGDVVIRLQNNPYPDKKHPFILCKFIETPFKVYGEGSGSLISDEQKVKTALKRALINYIAAGTEGQMGIKQGALSPDNEKKFLRGDNFSFNGSSNEIFFFGNFNQIPPSVWNFYSLITNEIEAISGVKSFAESGISGKGLGSTATGARGALDATALRRLHLVRNISENLVKPIGRKWLVYSAEFLDDTTFIRYTDEEVIAVTKDMLSGEYDIDIAVSTAEDNAMRAQDLSFMLQTTGNSLPFDFTQIILADIAKLYKMPDLANKIMTYTPKPDPMQQKLQETQLALLEAQVRNEQAKGAENEIDVSLKQAKAEKEAAMARKIGSESNLLDDEYLTKQMGETIDPLKVQEMQNKYDIEQAKVLNDMNFKQEKMDRDDRQRELDREVKASDTYLKHRLEALKQHKGL